MIAEAWKDKNVWIENIDGVCPVEEGTWIDVKYRDGEVKIGLHALTSEHGRDTQHAFWSLDEAANDIVFWRLHTPKDTILPEPTRPAPPMPACKPSKQGKDAFVEVPEPLPSYKVGRLTNSDILAAFNKLTGSGLSEDHYNTLLSLQEMFDGRG